jgi:hypothetical protein
METYKYVIRGSVSCTEWTGDNEVTLIGADIVQYLDDIKALLESDKDNLAQYIWDSEPLIKGIITEIYVDVENVNNTLYSRTSVTSTQKLSNEQKTALLKYLTGQFSDGYGEGIEQRDVRSWTDTETEDVWDEDAEDFLPVDNEVQCYLNFHLWQYENFEIHFLDDKEVEKVPTTPQKPRCKLIGENGNIYNLIGLAQKALLRAGVPEQAKKMRDKVLSAESYDEALVAIGEYVEIY